MAENNVQKLNIIFQPYELFETRKSILFDTENLAFMILMNFKDFQNFGFLSFVIIFGVRVACFLDFSFLLEHFWVKM